MTSFFSTRISPRGPITAFGLGAVVVATASATASWLAHACLLLGASLTVASGIMCGLACCSIAERANRSPDVLRWVRAADAISTIVLMMIGITWRETWVSLLRKLPCPLSFCVFSGLAASVVFSVGGLAGLLRGFMALQKKRAQKRQPRPGDVKTTRVSSQEAADVRMEVPDSDGKPQHSSSSKGGAGWKEKGTGVVFRECRRRGE